jgi:hypothetical protein
VDQEALVHGLHIGLRWSGSTLLLSGAVHVHRVHAWFADEGSFPCFSRGCAFAGGELAGEPPWRRCCPIGEGKSFPGSRRLRQWGQSGGQGFPRCWPRRAAARAPPACGNGTGLRHKPVPWCAWVTQRTCGHVGPVEGFFRVSGGFGHDGALPSTTAASVRWLRPR